MNGGGFLSNLNPVNWYKGLKNALVGQDPVDQLKTIKTQIDDLVNQLQSVSLTADQKKELNDLLSKVDSLVKDIKGKVDAYKTVQTTAPPAATTGGKKRRVVRKRKVLRK